MNKNSINKQTYTKMNKKSLFVLGFSAALLAGCSSDNVAPNGGDGDLSGDAYVSISLHLPTTSGVRAVENDDYDQGTSDEWNVDDVTAVFFDKDKMFVDAKTLSTNNWNKHNPVDGITADHTFDVQRVSPNVKYVLVLVNANGKTKVGINNFRNGTFESFNKVLDDCSASDFVGATKSSFFMSNSTKYDGEALVEVNPSRTENEAKAADKIAQVYVERAVAKVSIDVDATNANANWNNLEYTIPASDNMALARVGDKISFDNWALDVTNKKTYPVRKYDSSWSTDTYKKTYNGNKERNRFLSAYEFTKFGKRTFWATDPNYQANLVMKSVNGVNCVDRKNGGNTNEFYYLPTGSIPTEKSVAMTGVDYCLENTFDVAHMKQGETTRIVFKATYTPNGFTKGESWYLLGNSNTPLTANGVNSALNDASLTVYGVQMPATSGVYTWNDVRVKRTAAGSYEVLNSDEVTKLTNALGSDVTVYAGGVCYYVARIHHFGDELTPWDKAEDYTGTGKDYKIDYLGRYGVVRNNWYQMTLNTVSGPGTPDIPEIPNTPDDEQNYYLSTTVRIMDWAVRKQSLDF